MLFNSLQYFIFLPLVLVVYYHVRHRAQNTFLLLASYYFYGSWDYRFLALLIASTVVDYIVGLRIAGAREQGNADLARRWLLVSLITQLGILGFFKYFDFFIGSAESLLSGLGISASWPLLHIVLPVGISFYTFQSLSYTIDVYRGELEPVRRLDDFALYVAFFPQLVAGPIERATSLIPQVQRPRVVTRTNWDRGLYLILVGLVRKVVIADGAALLVDRTFASPHQFGPLQLAAGLVAYSLQIYGDFAGYSNIARGSALLLGFDLMRNFRHPYFARNVSDFWRRWHISLSTWLRDYLYIPLGGNRKGRRRTYINLMITMVLGGLWHGASWNFVIWGTLHGVYLVIYQAARRLRPAFLKSRPPSNSAIGNFLAVACTFVLSTFTWLFFRSHDVATTTAYLGGLFTLHGWLTIPAAAVSGFGLLGVLVLLTLIIDLPQAITDDEFCYLRAGVTTRAFGAAAAVLLLALSGHTATPFIYFQF